jgi:hypothetical protein
MAVILKTSNRVAKPAIPDRNVGVSMSQQSYAKAKRWSSYLLTKQKQKLQRVKGCVLWDFTSFHCSASTFH